MTSLALCCSLTGYPDAGRAVQQQLKAAKLQNGDEFTFKFEKYETPIGIWQVHH